MPVAAMSPINVRAKADAFLHALRCFAQNRPGQTAIAKADDATQPTSKVRLWRALTAHAGKVKVGVGVHQARKNGDVSEIEVDSLVTSRLDGGDLVAVNEYNTIGDQGTVNKKDVTCSDRPNRHGSNPV